MLAGMSKEEEEEEEKKKKMLCKSSTVDAATSTKLGHVLYQALMIGSKPHWWERAGGTK